MFSIQNYTTYSRLSGFGKVEDWVERADELGYDALGISEKQNLSSAIKFQEECEERDIQPIIGEEFLICPDITKQEKEKKEDIKGTLLLYAKNGDGLDNLVHLNNVANDRDRGFYYRPRLDISSIEDSSEGLICISPSVHGYGFGDDMVGKLSNLKECFGDDFYIGINPLNDDHKDHAMQVAPLKEEFNFVFTFDCHHPEKSDQVLDKEKYQFGSYYDILRSIESDAIPSCLDRSIDNSFMPNKNQVKYKCRENEISGFYGKCLEGLKQIKRKCDAKFQTGTYKMPEPNVDRSVEEDILLHLADGIQEKLCEDFEVPETIEDIDDLVNEVRRQGLMDRKPRKQLERGMDPDSLRPLSDYMEQLKYEYSTIEGMDYLEYFHIVHDQTSYIDEVHERGRGPTRGSAGGALISELLNILEVDPIYFDLMFERFLNPDRQDLPDIDLDFSTAAREDVKEYSKEQWGEDSFCAIAAYDRLKVKSAIKAVGKATANGRGAAIPDNDGNLISYSNVKIDGILTATDAKATASGEEELELRKESSDEFEDFCEKHSDWIEDIVMPMQGQIRTKGVHPCGYLITREPLEYEVPLFHSREYGKICQWDHEDAEEAGHPKFDFLGLDAINIISYINELVEMRHDESIPDISEVPLDDSDALKLFREANTHGKFQFNSYAQTQFMKVLRPEELAHLIAAVALIRPGPMADDAHIKYAKIKNGELEPDYPHPDLEYILEDTYGLIVYQEQIMKIVQEIAGFTRAEADYIRKATGKKKREEMNKWESEFMEGGKDNGYSEELLDDLWSTIVEFSEYSFNLAHATGYALLAYYQAYIQSRYPLEYWCAVLEFADEGSDSSETPQDLKHIVKQDNIEIVYPNLYSFAPGFEPVEGERKINWPLTAISSIGKKTAESICGENDRRGYESIKQMINETDNRSVHKGIFKKLIKARFFDPIGEPWEAAEKYFEVRNEEQGYNDDIPYEFKHKNRFRWYRERNEAFDMIVEPWKDVAPFHENVQNLRGDILEKMPEGKQVFAGGYVDGLGHFKTKYNQWYFKMYLVDEGERHLVMIWPDFVQANIDIINRLWKGQLVELIGSKTDYKGNPQIELGDPRCHFRIVWDEFREGDKHAA